MNVKLKSNTGEKFKAKIREAFRKFIVSLKRKPDIIPFAMLLISFLIYSLNLTTISNTTATVQGKGMGLCEFAIMLCSLLSMICLLNAFPKRQKPNYKMVAILMFLFVVIIVCDILYCSMISSTIAKLGNKIKEKQLAEYMLAQRTVIANAIFSGITAVAVILEPYFAKLLRKLNTSVEIEESNLSNIDLADEE